MKKILLVDDARLILEIERKLLERTGATLLVAVNGVEALKLAHAELPDAILLDLMLPDMTGDKVCAALKADPRTREIPIIMVTTKGGAEDVERCRRAGCDDFATKPLRHQELLAKVSSLLRIPHRVSKRVMVRLEAQLDSTGGAPSFGVATDLSATGMFVESGSKLDDGQELVLRIVVPGEGDATVRAKVVWNQPLLFHKRGYGLHFVSGEGDSLEKIARFVASRAV